ncbi:hypothetical protein PEP31012_03696 [Pandoraea eparura]|uniref:Uncharacterized protein n=1 Tax=Pandoraea eparura TaxID=2508291 RepID=A0A5E4X596_9BURK|nr:hypothetical protein [Pandoraea eparura]VVE31398.1 hypothetical protein PEP31012_03696 [Pandoraea eparura]
MTDKEMLELAAKAAVLTRYEDTDLWLDESGNVVTFDPLEDDGDALRLAVKLRLQITVTSDGVHAEGLPIGYLLPYAHEAFDGPGCDGEATRRAIVRAAAEIGKGM